MLNYSRNFALGQCTICIDSASSKVSFSYHSRAAVKGRHLAPLPPYESEQGGILLEMGNKDGFVGGPLVLLDGDVRRPVKCKRLPTRLYYLSPS